MEKFKMINKRNVLVSVVLTAILMIGLYNLTWASENNDTKEMVAQRYIDALANKDSSKIVGLGIQSYGMDPAYFYAPLVTLDQAERQGLLKETSKNIKTDAEIEMQIMSQYDSVVNSFGKNAWENLSFEFTKEDHLDGTIAYIEKGSKEQITEEEYEKLNLAYWQGLAEANGITYEQLFRFNDPKLDNASAYQYHTLFLKGLETIPTDTIVLTDYDLYRVTLKFGEKTIGEDGMENYRFYISNQSGGWKVVDGLTWDYPLGEPSEAE